MKPSEFGMVVVIAFFFAALAVLGQWGAIVVAALLFMVVKFLSSFEEEGP